MDEFIILGMWRRNVWTLHVQNSALDVIYSTEEYVKGQEENYLIKFAWKADSTTDLYT